MIKFNDDDIKEIMEITETHDGIPVVVIDTEAIPNELTEE